MTFSYNMVEIKFVKTCKYTQFHLTIPSHFGRINSNQINKVIFFLAFKIPLSGKLVPDWDT